MKTEVQRIAKLALRKSLFHWKKNLLTKCYDDRKTNVACRVLTRKTDALWWPYVIGTHLQTKCHKDRTINVVARVLIRQILTPHDAQRKKVITKAHLRTMSDSCDSSDSCNPWSSEGDMNRLLVIPGSHVIQLTGTIFELNSHIKETNVLSKFQENWAKNVTSAVFTCFHFIHIEKNAPPTGGHVFSPIPTIFKLVRDINKTNVLTNFHDNWAKIVTSRKNAPPTGGHVFSPILTIFELFGDIN
ncbi:hypothetical protein DPMN_014482 [Dreissena polymorpha]|uniref:Uncharacterized protein n=1 Tax=Dreissena polymorpha TaxID=45954 RepID=A0A9D4S3H5_DREPO|nr:hypothetical protein DPMN_014482 [Dreissena polymorpha]